MKKSLKCPRCEAIGRKPEEGKHLYIGINGIKVLLCDKCNNELKEEENFTYALEENETES